MTRYHWIIPVVVGIILFVIFVLAYNFSSISTGWIWASLVLALVFLFLGFSFHATEVVAQGPQDGNPYVRWVYSGPSDLEALATPYPVRQGFESSCP